MMVLSLFDGISCGMVALKRVNIPIEKYVAYEIDKYAIQISQKHYPQIEQCGDVTIAEFKQYKNYDLLIGGSPCQDLSIASGKRRVGLNGSRSSLFWHYVRALNECKPKYFLFENNYRMPKDAEYTITKELGVQPILINSSSFSAQSRNRLYWTNIPVDVDYINSIANKTRIVDILESKVDEKYYVPKPVVLRENILTQLDKPKILYIGDLVMKGSQQIRRVYSKWGLSPTVDTAQGGYRQVKIYDDGLVRKLTPLEYERLQTLPDNYTQGISDTQRYKCIGNGWTIDVIAYILSRLKGN